MFLDFPPRPDGPDLPTPYAPNSPLLIPDPFFDPRTPSFRLPSPTPVDGVVYSSRRPWRRRQVVRPFACLGGGGVWSESPSPVSSIVKGKVRSNPHRRGSGVGRLVSWPIPRVSPELSGGGGWVDNLRSLRVGDGVSFSGSGMAGVYGWDPSGSRADVRSTYRRPTFLRSGLLPVPGSLPFSFDGTLRDVRTGSVWVVGGGGGAGRRRRG